MCSKILLELMTRCREFDEHRKFLRFRTHGFATTMLRTGTLKQLHLDQRRFAFGAWFALCVCAAAFGWLSPIQAQQIKSALVARGSWATPPSPPPVVPTFDAPSASDAALGSMHSAVRSARRQFTTASTNLRITKVTAPEDPTPILDPAGDVNPLVDPVPVADPAAESQASRVAASEPGILDGRTIACQAACCWPLAKFLEERAASIRADGARGHKAGERSAALQSNFLRRQAARQRDVAAATALRAYYSWIANREQLIIVAAGFDLQREQSATQNALIERGIGIDDPTELERKRLELRDKQLQLESNDIQLAQSVRRLTCCASDPRTAIVETLQVQPTVLPCDQLVGFALQHRQDYLSYVELCQNLDEQSARAIADLLSPLAGGVGLGMLDLNFLENLCLAAHGSDALTHVTRELRTAIDLERRLIQQAVCDKCHALSLAYERTAIAEQLLATWNERIAGLSRLEQLGEARGQAVALARAEQLQARSTLVSRQLAAKLAEVDLAEAMGDLAPRCCRGEPWLVTCN